MNSRKLLAAVFVVLGLLSGAAYFLKPQPRQSDKTILVWATDENPARVNQVEAFTREHPEIEVRIDHVNNTTATIIRECLEGMGPDIIDMNSRNRIGYIEERVLMDVTGPADQMGFSLTANSWPTAEQTGLYKGRQYGYFCNVGAPIVLYNKNIFDDFGVPYPKERMTWDEFLNMAVKVTSPPSTNWEKSIFAIADAGMGSYFESLCGQYFTEDGLPIMKSEEMRAAFQWHKDVLFKYKIMPRPSDLKLRSSYGRFGGKGGQGQFIAGNVAMIITGHWMMLGCSLAYPHQVEEYEKAKLEGRPLPNRPLRLGAFLVPTAGDRPPSFMLGGRMAGINAYSSKSKQALLFLQYLAGPTYAAEVNKSMDWLPGNPAYADLGVEDIYPDLAFSSIHRLTKEGMQYGYVLRESPFLSATEVSTAISIQIARLEADPALEVTDLIDALDNEVDLLLRKRLDRDSALRKLYEERVAKAASK